MSNEATENRDRLTTWVVGGSVPVAGALVVVAIVWSWRLQIVASGLQLLGILMTALGVAVVWSQVELAADKAIDAKHGLGRWYASSRHKARGWLARRRGRPSPTMRVGTTWQSSYAIHDDLVRRPPPETLEDERARLEFLDAELDDVYARINAIQRDIGGQGEQLRVEIRRETRQGWQLIVAGLWWSAVGTAIGIGG
jgi:hypothetical protein